MSQTYMPCEFRGMCVKCWNYEFIFMCDE